MSKNVLDVSRRRLRLLQRRGRWEISNSTPLRTLAQLIKIIELMILCLLKELIMTISNDFRAKNLTVIKIVKDNIRSLIRRTLLLSQFSALSLLI